MLRKGSEVEMALSFMMPVIWTCCHPCFLRLLKVETGVTQHGDNVANWIRLVFVLPDRERCHSGDSGVRALGRYC